MQDYIVCNLETRQSERLMRFDPTHYWYQPHLNWFSCLLLPFSWLFGAIVKFRVWLYRLGILRSYQLPIPVVVVGNITVGGTGKTPFVIWLSHYLKEQGYRPGIVSRGAGGVGKVKPHLVSLQDDVMEVGDEAMLLVNHADCPLVIGIDRVAAAQYLIQETQCNIIISDDGLQHYALKRDLEIVIVDGDRHFGNQQLLPAGPLREPLKRLKQVDQVIINGKDMILMPGNLVSLRRSDSVQPLQYFNHRIVHAIAGIGHPQRFFGLLEQAGITAIKHIFPDHYRYTEKDIQFNDGLPVIMTEKDAVKCFAFATDAYWYLPVKAQITKDIAAHLFVKLKGLSHEIEEDFSKSCRHR